MNKYLTSIFAVLLLAVLTACAHSSKIKTASVNPEQLHRFFQNVGQNQLQQVELALKQGHPINASNEIGVTPLMLASYKGLDEMVLYLLSHGADPRLYDDRKTTALHYAAQRGHAEVIKHLLDHGAEVSSADADGFTPLHISARFGSLQSTSLLLNRGADSNIKDALGTPVLFFAIVRLSREQVRLLIAKGARVNVPDADDVSPLARSIEVQSKEIFDDLLTEYLKLPVNERGPLADIEGNTAVHYAAIAETDDFLKRLIEAKANWPMDLNFQNKAGQTPAMWAAARRKRAQLELLLSENINLDLVDKNGWDLREHLLSKDFSESEVDELFRLFPGKDED